MLKSRKVTLKMIGEMAGVSHQTVSLVLKDAETPRVGKVKRDKVLKLVRELNFTPDVRARSLVTGKTDTLAVAGTASLADMDTLFPARIYAGIGEVAMENGYILSFLPLLSGAKDRDLVPMIQGRVADGLIIIVYSRMEEHFKTLMMPELEKAGIPFVAIHSGAELLPCNCVGYNAEKAGTLVGAHLAERTDSGITFIGYGFSSYNSSLYRGCSQAAEKAGKTVKRIDLPGNYYLDKADYGYEYGKEIIETHGVDGAYMIFSDAFALGFTDALEEAGYRVPDDVLVAGCDDLFKPGVMRSRLTTVNRNPEEMGRQAARIFFGISGQQREDEIRTEVIEPELIIRKSTSR